MNTDSDLVYVLPGSPPVRTSLRLHGLDQVYIRASQLTSLKIGPTPATRLLQNDLLMVFKERMPALQQLTLEATYGPGSTADVGVLQPNLQWDNLPRLQFLVLNGVCLPETGVLGCALRRLELSNYPREESQLPFARLLGTLTFSATSLEELHINNYLKVAKLEWVDSNPFSLSKLSRLVIHDSPPHIAHLLRYVHLPRASNVKLSANFLKYMIDGGKVVPTLHTMLPASYHALDIPSLRPTAVEVFVSSDMVTVLGMAMKNPFTTTRIEGRACGALSDPSTRVQTYARTVESLGSLFSVANVTRLEITGDFSTSATDTGLYVYDTTVTSAKPPSNDGTMYPFGSNNQEPFNVVPTFRPPVPNWLAVLAQFPSLSDLSITDCGGAAPPESFAVALAGTDMLVCCPHLKDLRLEGIIHDKPFLDKLAEALEAREDMRLRLGTLTIIMSSPARRSIREKVEETFLRFADTVCVKFA
ncbi:hypothetical protein K466DRAFT_659436 [Polyporus arcularius HHB13444]|uniref:F-box domain-containing protein n=1 Tax=Polyporus arcularius HHB13444 TaxID=1314778 RepID=A0A5C3Q1F3_9APHY|nr:hypothetical protein K466DRAFT_659436 [Polyporus arcularius HHB13444]